MPENVENRLEKKQSHNSVEKRRKDKLKMAIDDFRKYLPASILKNQKWTHHEILLKAIEYMKYLEQENKKFVTEGSDAVKNELIIKLKAQLEDCFKEIGKLKDIIEKQCITVPNLANIAKHWTPRNSTENKSCQVNDALIFDFLKNDASNGVNIEKSQKSFTIAQYFKKSTIDAKIQPTTALTSKDFCNGVESTSTMENNSKPKSLITFKTDSKKSNPTNKINTISSLVSLNNNSNSSFISTFMHNGNQSFNSFALLCPSGQILPVSNGSLAFNVFPCVTLQPSIVNPIPSSSVQNTYSVDNTKTFKTIVPHVNEDINLDNVIEEIAVKNKVSLQSNKISNEPKLNRKKFKVLHCCHWYKQKHLKNKYKFFNWKCKKNVEIKTTLDSIPESAEEVLNSNVNKTNNLPEVSNGGTSSGELQTDDSTNADKNTVNDNVESLLQVNKISKPIWTLAKNIEEPSEKSVEDKNAKVKEAVDITFSIPTSQNLSVFNGLENSENYQMENNESDFINHNFEGNLSNTVSQSKSSYHNIGNLLTSSNQMNFDKVTSNKNNLSNFNDETAAFTTNSENYLNEAVLNFDFDEIFPEAKAAGTNKNTLNSSKDWVPKDSIQYNKYNDSFNVEDPFTSNFNLYLLDKEFVPAGSNANNFAYKSAQFQNFNRMSSDNGNAGEIFSKSSSFEQKNLYCNGNNANVTCNDLQKRSSVKASKSLEFESQKDSNGQNSVFKESYNSNQNNCRFNNSSSSHNSYVSPGKIDNSYVRKFNNENMTQFNFSHNGSDKLPTENVNIQISKQLHKPNKSTTFLEESVSICNQSSLKNNSNILNKAYMENNNSTSFNNANVNDIFSKSNEIISFSAPKKKFDPLNHSNLEYQSKNSNAPPFETLINDQSDFHTNKNKPFSFYPLSYNEMNKPPTDNFNLNKNDQYLNHKQSFEPNPGYLKANNFFDFCDSSESSNFSKNTSLSNIYPAASIRYSGNQKFYESTNNPSNSQYLSMSLTKTQYATFDPNNQYKTKDSTISNSINNVPTTFTPYLNLSVNSDAYPFSTPSSPPFLSKSTNSTVKNFHYKSPESINAHFAKPSSKRPILIQNKSASKKYPKFLQDSSKHQKLDYQPGYESSSFPPNFYVASHDRPTYLTNDDSFLPSYNTPYQSAPETNLNTFLIPPLPAPSHQSNEIKLNFYPSHSTSISDFTQQPPLTSSHIPLPSKRLPSALPSIHHFGISNLFTDLSHPLGLTAESNGSIPVKPMQPEPFFQPSHHYPYDFNVDNVTSSYSHLPSTVSYYQNHSFFANSGHSGLMNQQPASKNSMSINSLLGNQKTV